MLANHPIFKSQRLEERLKEVHHSDVENFIFQKEQSKKNVKTMSFSKALWCLENIGGYVTLKSEKGNWYLYKPTGQNVRVVNCETGDSEELSPSPNHLNSKEWIIYGLKE